jgi:hypothetical protein
MLFNLDESKRTLARSQVIQPGWEWNEHSTHPELFNPDESKKANLACARPLQHIKSQTQHLANICWNTCQSQFRRIT